MEWGKGLDAILDVIDTKLHVAPPGGVELVVYWAGNDVYGNYGYLGYTWHLTSKWVKRPQEEIDRIAHWPAKQKLLVERGIDRLIDLQSHPKVRGLTVLVGGDNGRFFNLPSEYDDEMGRYAQKLASGGVSVIDPCSLLMRTSRPDGFHMEVNEHNATVASSWWHSQFRAILTDRLIAGRKAEFIANRRSIVFHNHFVLGKPEPSLTVPPASKRILEPLEPVLHQDEEVEPEEARDDEEQIVFDQPVMQLLPDVVAEPALVSEDGEEVTQVDHVLFSRDHDSELPLDLVAVDPDAQEDFAFNLAAEAVNNISARVEDADAIEKEAEEGIETVWQDEAVPDVIEQSEVPASGEDRVYPHGSVGYSMALRDMGSAPKSKAAPTSDDQVEIKEEVDFDGDEAMGSADATADVLASDESYEMWYSAEDFPDFPSGHRYMSDRARFSLSKTMTYYLRGHSNDERSQRQNRPPPRITIDPTTHAVEWGHFKEILSSCWRNFSSLKAIEVVKFSHSDKDDRGRFEVLVRVHPHGLEYLAIRCFQGHNRNLISEESDLKAIHRDFHFLCSEWEPSLTSFPVVGVTGYTCDKWDSMPKVGYHATFWSNFPNLVAFGLVPGGVTLGGSTGRAFSMMAKSPIWLRESNAGLRPGAEVESPLISSSRPWKGSAFLRRRMMFSRHQTGFRTGSSCTPSTVAPANAFGSTGRMSSPAPEWERLLRRIRRLASWVMSSTVTSLLRRRKPALRASMNTSLRCIPSTTRRSIGSNSSATTTICRDPHTSGRRVFSTSMLATSPLRGTALSRERGRNGPLMLRYGIPEPGSPSLLSDALRERTTS